MTGRSAMTEEIMRMAMSDRGGWTREQLACLGVPWPPPSGWRDGLMGKEFDNLTLMKFVSLKGTSKKKSIPAGAMFTPLAPVQMKDPVPASIDQMSVIEKRAKMLVANFRCSKTTECKEEKCSYPACMCV